ncbi:hypothetical protein JOB18_010175 [Solea senegalensis]|uniref:Uncharacterized protein n=1 Tax=Solea senegalensis TaxID=28829 RepID=A0AAV6SEF3_SOLSE|nr:hypothetical protein JOB18_010175 [Solea senegalensis]KAG7515510.1 hypothetical protein JOB18_010175 [Solea senegalensis]
MSRQEQEDLEEDEEQQRGQLCAVTGHLDPNCVVNSPESGPLSIFSVFLWLFLGFLWQNVKKNGITPCCYVCGKPGEHSPAPTPHYYNGSGSARSAAPAPGPGIRSVLDLNQPRPDWHNLAVADKSTTPRTLSLVGTSSRRFSLWLWNLKR